MGKTADRSELAACLDYLREGDTLVVPSLDRLSRSLQDLITIVAGVRRPGSKNGRPATRYDVGKNRHTTAAKARLTRSWVLPSACSP